MKKNVCRIVALVAVASMPLFGSGCQDKKWEEMERENIRWAKARDEYNAACIELYEKQLQSEELRYAIQKEVEIIRQMPTYPNIAVLTHVTSGTNVVLLALTDDNIVQVYDGKEWKEWK